VSVTREPEWTPDQVALVLAVEEYEQMLGPHGQPRDESMSSDSDPSNPRGKRYYVAGVPTMTPEGRTVHAPLIDWAQRSQDQAMQRYKDSAGEGADLSGLVFPVQVVERSGG
jgi:hypothetical protein